VGAGVGGAVGVGVGVCVETLSILLLAFRLYRCRVKAK
jgi:hypothetical protein